MNYFTDQYHHPAKKKKKPARPNSLADLQGAEAPSKSRDMKSLPDFSQINGLPPLPGTSAAPHQFTPEQIAEARREQNRPLLPGEVRSLQGADAHPAAAAGARGSYVLTPEQIAQFAAARQGGIQPEYSNLVELEAHPAAEPAAEPVNYADIELEELKQSLQPEPVAKSATAQGVDLADQAPGTSPGAPVSVAPVATPTPVVTPTTDVIPAGVRELEQTQDFVPVDPNAAAAEAEREREAEAAEYAALEAAEAERKRDEEYAALEAAEAEAERKRDEDFTIEHQRLEEIRAGNREQDIARAKQKQRYAEARRETEQQRLEEMEQEQLRTELSDAQQKLADAMGAVPEATTAPAADPPLG